METDIVIITTPFMFGVSVNCYLVGTGDGFILIDTGRQQKRHEIEMEIERAGCNPGDLDLILLTHGDFDHCGNAAYFREKFNSKIAMHVDDSGMVEYGDMTWNRKKQNVIIRAIFGLLINLNEADRFRPDVTINDGQDLSDLGFDASVVSIPGHSKGSLGFQTAGGDFFCGDLLANTKKPDIWSIIDDPAAAQASIEKLSGLDIGTVYPGHGDPFEMELFIQNYRPDQEGTSQY